MARADLSKTAAFDGIPAPVQTVGVHPAATHAVASQYGIVPDMVTPYFAEYSANQRVRYVRIMSAPARLIAVSCSKATAS